MGARLHSTKRAGLYANTPTVTIDMTGLRHSNMHVMHTSTIMHTTMSELILHAIYVNGCGSVAILDQIPLGAFIPHTFKLRIQNVTLDITNLPMGGSVAILAQAPLRSIASLVGPPSCLQAVEVSLL